MSHCIILFPYASFFSNNAFATVRLEEMNGCIPTAEHGIKYSAYNTTFCKRLCN